MLTTAQVQERYKLALDRHQKGEFDQAQALYAEVLESVPDHADALHLSGVAAAQTGNHLKAVELIGKAIALRPGEAVFHCNKGIALNGLGEFDKAVASFDNAIAVKEDFPEAYYHRGNALKQLKSFEKAIASYDRATAIKADFYLAHFNRGNALWELDKYEAALESYDRAIAIKPDFAEAYSNRGVLLQQMNAFLAALESFDNAIAIKPDYYEAYSNRGIVLKELKAFEAALASFDNAIAIRPDYCEAFFNRGLLLHELKQLDAALANFDQAVAIKPDYPEAYFNRGLLLHELKQLEAALANYDEAIAIKPDYHEAYSNRGLLLHELKRLDAALDSFDEAIAIKADDHELYSNRGNTLRDLKQLDAAVTSFDKAISLKPDFAEAYSNRGNALLDLRQLDAALASFDKAISLKPDFAEAYFNRGIALNALKQLDAALESYDKAISLKHDYAGAVCNKSLTLLLCGDFRQGWELYESRWQLEDVAPNVRNFKQPLWLGKEPLTGKTILLHSEQGFGDTIQFCRYVPLVAALGARVIVEVELPLAGLLKELDGVSGIVVKGRALPDFDYHCPWLSLPLAFNTELETIPSGRQYLKSDPAKLAYWENKLNNKTEPRVGVAWSGNDRHTPNYYIRSMPLSMLIPYLPKGFTYVSLQKEVRDSDKSTLESNGKILQFGDELVDFTDTAALCDLMDIVISIDTSVAHLSAALGRPTWVLVPFSPDWRWLLDRDDSPWYPSIRLFRQQKPYDWSGPLVKLNSALRTDQVKFALKKRCNQASGHLSITAAPEGTRC
ncbi:MAG TPA: tetratricopeptide repeat protein [Chlorobaculum sp.]|nr:tetratricopeptide repeat protein [Chlorobaculum sp.]